MPGFSLSLCVCVSISVSSCTCYQGKVTNVTTSGIDLTEARRFSLALEVGNEGRNGPINARLGLGKLEPRGSLCMQQSRHGILERTILPTLTYQLLYITFDLSARF